MIKKQQQTSAEVGSGSATFESMTATENNMESLVRTKSLVFCNVYMGSTFFLEIYKRGFIVQESWHSPNTLHSMAVLTIVHTHGQPAFRIIT